MNTIKINRLFLFKPDKELWISLAALIACVLFNFIADLFRNSMVFYIFYQGIFALGICIFFPLWFTAIKLKQPLSTIGITKDKWMKAVLVGVLIAVFSTLGRMQGLEIVMPSSDFLIIIVACMLMSTLFEEIFFRGFLQTRFEKTFGTIPAVILSGFCFSIYHIGYGNIRGDIPELVSLFFIGVFFSISFRITNNIITSYIVNLPQAVLTFIGERSSIEYSAHFNGISAVISIITALLGLLLIIIVNARQRLSFDIKKSQNAGTQQMH
jgi:membrane protease YdiL (CAAX protease family)